MCGIAGVLRITPRGQTREDIPEAWLDALDEHIAWRGPDGHGRFRDTATRPDGSIVEVALVHRRLSIIDHEGGAQPMVSERGRIREDGTTEGLVAVAFNGCIYNARELREELTVAGGGGHEFVSEHSDTEVLIHLYRSCAGDLNAMAERLEGMYAFAIWDRERARLTLGRDPFGEKPLYTRMSSDMGALFFASSVPAIESVLRLAGKEWEFDRKQLVAWVSMGFADAPPFGGNGGWTGRGVAPVSLPIDWSFKDSRRVNALAPALFVAVLAVFLVVTRGWGWIILLALALLILRDRQRNRGVFPHSSEDDQRRQHRKRSPAFDHGVVDGLLRASVERRLESDVPLGCFLSGGIDSPLIALHAQRALGNLTTLCVRMNDPRYDESAHARHAAKVIGSNHIEVDITSSMRPAEDLVHLIQTLGLPFGDSSILPTYWVCNAARQHMKVVLSGDGGDELFYGYDRYCAAARFGAAAQMLAWLAPTPRCDDPKSARERRARFIIAARHRWYLDLLAIFPTPDRRALLGRRRGGANVLEQVRGRRRARDWDIEHYLPGDLLRKVDTASMSAGLEVRCPFLDSELAAYADRIPVSQMMPRGQRKGFLRDIARKYFPDELVDRPKMGFAIPIGEWFRDDFGGMRTLMLDMLAGERPFGDLNDDFSIRMPFVRRMIEEHTERRRDHSQRLFALTSLAIWARSGE